jgi:single-strand DNA-binding protein
MTTTITTTVRTPEKARHGVTLVGNLTREPELRFAASGTAWASCGLAVNHRRRRDDGTWEELPPHFFDLVCFGEVAENLADSLSKGDRVIACGRLEEDKWADRTGAERTTQRLVADELGASLRFAAVDVRESERGTAVPRPVVDDEEDPF